MNDKIIPQTVESNFLKIATCFLCCQCTQKHCSKLVSRYYKQSNHCATTARSIVVRRYFDYKSVKRN